MGFNCTLNTYSINSFGMKLATFNITIPRIILAEFNTHRDFTRNSASSRAIPLKKTIKSIFTDPFIPLNWMKDHTGMQGTSFFQSKFWRFALRTLWLMARDVAIVFAWLLNKIGLSKQICNRILEPWMWHTVLVTSSEWENFFALRAHDQAEIHIQRIAYLMLEKLNEITPRQLNEGEWHIPFVEEIDSEKLRDLLMQNDGKVDHTEWLNSVLKISTAMNARTSYTVVGAAEKKHNYVADMVLHDRLVHSGHWSPLEHIAKPMTNDEYFTFTRTQPLIFGETAGMTVDEAFKYWLDQPHSDVLMHPETHTPYQVVHYGWCGNFRGFIQYRKTFPGERRKDTRLKSETITIEM